ncbi:MAG: hypothetical protein QME32_07110 [Endomicrobiia bacterium]|nr:hypothetical protein [Endomicrobiia bacterium]
MNIHPVETSKDLREFVDLPWKIYGRDPAWAPPLKSEVLAILDANKNPFWDHASRRLYLARDKSGAAVARAAAIIDDNFIEFHRENTGFFGFFESVDDPSAARALFETVEGYLASRGIKKIIGPTAPSTNDEMGFLVEGFDTPPFIMMPHNPPYYQKLSLASGYRPAKNLLAYLMTEQNTPKERIERLVSLVRKKEPYLVVRPINPRNFDSEVKKIWEIYNNAWEKNWGFVPWTQKEFDAQCAKLKPLMIPDLILLAEIKDRPVGVLAGVPNYSEVLMKLNGRLGPVEILKFLYYKTKIKAMRVMIMGVIKEYRNRGIEGVMFSEIIKNGPKHGIYTAEMSWILEDNVMMRRAAEMLGGYVYKKYTVFEKEINPAP